MARRVVRRLTVMAQGGAWVQMEIVFYGVRGTRMVTGAPFERYGGETACVGVHVHGVNVLFDGGTGIAAAGAELAGKATPVPIFLSHLHHDHLAGLPFFAPMFESGRRVDIFIPDGMKEKLLAYFAPPYYPLTVDDLPADVTITQLPPNASVDRYHSVTGEGIVVHSLRLPADVHPRDGVTVYAVQAGDRRVVYASDVEWLRASVDDQRRLLDFARGANVFILDAQYVGDEYDAFAGRGHNTVLTATQVGRMADVDQLVLFHHDPHRDDAAIDELERIAQGSEAARGLGRVCAARAGLRLTV